MNLEMAATGEMLTIPEYVADEEAILVGARAMSAVLLSFLEEHR